MNLVYYLHDKKLKQKAHSLCEKELLYHKAFHAQEFHRFIHRTFRATKCFINSFIKNFIVTKTIQNNSKGFRYRIKSFPGYCLRGGSLDAVNLQMGKLLIFRFNLFSMLFSRNELGSRSGKWLFEIVRFFMNWNTTSRLQWGGEKNQNGNCWNLWNSRPFSRPPSRIEGCVDWIGQTGHCEPEGR